MALAEETTTRLNPKRVRRREVLTLRLLAIVLAGLAAAGGYLWVGQNHQNHLTARLGHTQSQLAHVEARIEAGSYGNCHRLNIERARNNSNWHSSYQADKDILHYDLTFKTLIVASLHEPAAAPRTQQQEQQAALFLSKLEVEINGVRANMKALIWVPLTDCVEAVQTNPAAYIPPEQRSLQHNPPPRAAFVLGPRN